MRLLDNETKLSARQMLRFRLISFKNTLLGIIVFGCCLMFLMLNSEKSVKPETIMRTSVVLPTDSSLLENDCRIPYLQIRDPEIDKAAAGMPFGPVSCTKQTSNLAYLTEDHILFIQRDLDSKWNLGGSPFYCNVSALKGGLKPAVGSFRIEPLNITLRLGNRRQIPVDQFVVHCYNETNNQIIYTRAFAGFANAQKQKEKAPLAKPTSPSLIVLILDSVAHNQFKRHASKSYDYMKQLDFVFMNAYNKVSDNTGVNLFPVLAGRSTEAKVGGNGKELVSKLPVEAESIEFIWDIMKKKSCITMFNDDIMASSRGLFAYHNHNGFRKPPTNYYFRPFSLFNVKNEVKPNLGHCTIHGQSLVDQHLGFLERFTRVFKDHCHFSLNFLPTATHDRSDQLEVEDIAIRSVLEKFHALGVMENSVIAIMGDHGNRIGAIQQTYTGRVEERMPLFSLYLPPQLRNQYPHYYTNLLYNSNRLTSNYDIYRTLRTIALLGGKPQKEQINYRGYSLLTERVPSTRSCTDAGIPENFCVCLEQKPLPKFKRGDTKFVQFETFLRGTFVANTQSCVLGTSLIVMDDEIRSLAISPMVRQGWRDMNPKKLQYNSYIEVNYHDLRFHVTSIFNDRLRLHVRLSRYLDNDTLLLLDSPLVIGKLKMNGDEKHESFQPISLNNYCFKNLNSSM
ncbi:hypothetical protein M3Y94_00278100 [Aphelenchoides besseyi]|nr:hypothetical protein M3Y94_00278100 [Aphelenchoides besseyi]KAI6236023.1 hypothetical protein M3Y95_00113400 [Aphelenchoides besseyi]